MTVYSDSALPENVEDLMLVGGSIGIGNVLDDVIKGNLTDNTLDGLAGNDRIDGGAGNDRILGGEGDDTLDGGADATYWVRDDNGRSAIQLSASDVDNNVGSLGVDGGLQSTIMTMIVPVEGHSVLATNADFIDGGSGNDRIDGGSGDDTLMGGAGNDVIYGGDGAHVYVGPGYVDTTGGNDILDGGAGRDRMVGGTGNDTYYVRDSGDTVIELANEGMDAVYSSRSLILAANVENLILTGTVGSYGVGNALDNTLTGNDGSNFLNGLLGADTLVGGLGDDTYNVDNSGDLVIERVGEGTDRVVSEISTTLGENVENLTLSRYEAIKGTGNALNNDIVGNTASNILSGLGGNDQLTGNAGDDTLLGGDGNDSLNGEAGIDFLDGGEGHDTLTDTSGSGCFNGGAGTDHLTGGTSAEIYLGGLGNDTLTTDAGNDVILFNKGDGQDTFAAGGTGSDTLSLGGNFAYTDLSFSRSANHLVLKMGAADQITFSNWYAAAPSKPVVNLQVIAEAMAGFDAGGSDPLLDQKVENFDFAGLASAFDAARAATPTLSTWALSNALLTFQLAGSDSAALGGDLAYQYGKNGTLAGMGVTAAQEVIANASFGSQAQTLQALSGSPSGALRLN